MSAFETKDDEINVEDIMCKIRAHLKNNRQNGKHRDLAIRRSDEMQGDPLEEYDFQRDLEYINSNWAIQNKSYNISSHRQVMGKALVKGRELVHGEVRRYVDPMIWKQTNFNESVVRILNEIKSYIQDRQAIRSSDIEEQAELIISAMNADIENKSWLARILEEKVAKSKNISSEACNEQYDSINYLAFENRFRGSREEIKGKQSTFIGYFEGCNNVLDIGCGRGEFLETLKERGIEGYGIDSSEEMVNFCKSKELNVEKTDAVSYLDEVADKSFDGIFIDQVVEHLEPNYLIRMLELSFKKLNYGGIIVVETVNPTTFSAIASFYIDMSHKKPVHPDTLRFLLDFAGFKSLETIFLNPIPENARLKKIEYMDGEIINRRVIDICNHNSDILNSTLFGAQDYAIVGKKQN